MRACRARALPPGKKEAQQHLKQGAFLELRVACVVFSFLPSGSCLPRALFVAVGLVCAPTTTKSSKQNDRAFCLFPCAAQPPIPPRFSIVPFIQRGWPAHSPLSFCLFCAPLVLRSFRLCYCRGVVLAPMLMGLPPRSSSNAARASNQESQQQKEGVGHPLPRGLCCFLPLCCSPLRASS